VLVVCAGCDDVGAVLSHLNDKNAPTGRLSERIAGGPHDELGCRLFFLDRLDITDTPIAAADAFDAVRATHEALTDLPVPLPTFDDNLALARALFADPTRTATVPENEREFCLIVGSQLRARFDVMTWHSRVLHGDPWIGGNLVNTSSGARLVDFEAVCRGPLEWDLSSFAGDDLDNVDESLLAVCRTLRRFTVAAWCWAQPGRAPEVDEAARWHLNALHTSIDD
jgi:hypothetical protein